MLRFVLFCLLSSLQPCCMLHAPHSALFASLLSPTTHTSKTPLLIIPSLLPPLLRPRGCDPPPSPLRDMLTSSLFQDTLVSKASSTSLPSAARASPASSSASISSCSLPSRGCLVQYYRLAHPSSSYADACCLVFFSFFNAALLSPFPHLSFPPHVPRPSYSPVFIIPLLFWHCLSSIIFLVTLFQHWSLTRPSPFRPMIAIGAVAERGRLGPTLVFVFIWSTLVYGKRRFCFISPFSLLLLAFLPTLHCPLHCLLAYATLPCYRDIDIPFLPLLDPIACWTWNSNGWSFVLGGLDFAGGTPVHISSGTAALAIRCGGYFLLLSPHILFIMHAAFSSYFPLSCGL